MKTTRPRLRICFPVLLGVVVLLPHSPAWARTVSTKENSAVSTAQPRLVVQLGHSRDITSAAFSPDGHYVLSGGDDGAVKLWEVDTGREVRTFSGHGYVASVAFSPNGHYVLSSGIDGGLKLWEVATGKEIRSFSDTRRTVGLSTAGFSRDGHTIFSGSAGGFTFWKVATGREIGSSAGPLGGTYAVALSPDGRTALVGGDDFLSENSPIILWDITSGQAIRNFAGHSFRTLSAVFAPDGRTALSGSYRELKLWEVATGRELHTFAGHAGEVTAVAFAPDGRTVLSGDNTGDLKLWDVATGQELHSFKGHTNEVSAVVFAPDGHTVLTGGWDKLLKLWDVATGKEIRAFAGRSDVVSSTAFSPDTSLLLAGTDDGPLKLWDLAAGQQVRTFAGHQGGIEAIVFSPDGHTALSGSSDKTLRLWDVTTGKMLRTFTGHSGYITSVDFSLDGRSVLSGSFDNTLRLWDVSTGNELLKLGSEDPSSIGPSHYEWILSVAFSPDGHSALSASAQGEIKLWDLSTGKEIRLFAGPSLSGFQLRPVRHVAFSADGRYALSADGRYDLSEGDEEPLRIWEIATGKETQTFVRNRGGPVAFSPDGQYALVGTWNKAFKVWEIATGKILHTFGRSSERSSAGPFFPDGPHTLTVDRDGAMRIWQIEESLRPTAQAGPSREQDASTSHELCTLVSFIDDTWAVVDPHGRYDASNAGDVQGLHWVVGNESLALSQLKERYYEPGLLSKILGWNQEPLREVSGFQQVKLFPAVEYQAPAPGRTQIKLKLTNRGGGIGRVRVLVNGKEVAADARGPQLSPQATKAELTVDLAGAPLKPEESNQLEVIAWNADGYLSSRGVVVNWTPTGSPPAKAPELYAIVGGITEYASPALRLRFAARDAEDIAKALQLGAQRLFGAEKVHLILLRTTDDPHALTPSKANFRKAFEEARTATPEDILVVYLAGHGIALHGESDLYAYLTREARSTDLSDPAVRAQVAITSEELVEWIKRVPALKQVMILDTCAAGALTAKLIEKRDVPTDQIRALERLKDRTGFHILMGSAADKVSYEATQYGQGLLTYALLQGMRGAALREDEYVDVSRLFQYATDLVPQLAVHIGGVQKPLIAAPRGDSFDVGQLKKEDKVAIPLAIVKPLILRPVLLNREQGFDNLELMAAVRKRLQEESDSLVRGRTSEQAAVYVDAEELPGAIRPSGTYTVKGQQVKAHLFLIRDGQKVATFQVEGAQDDPAGLAARIVAGITQTMAGLSR